MAKKTDSKDNRDTPKSTQSRKKVSKPAETDRPSTSRAKVKKEQAKATRTTKANKSTGGKAAGQGKKKEESAQATLGEQGFWEDVQENISEGAKVVNEETREFAEKVAGYSEKIFGVVKEKAEEAFRYSTDLTKDAVNYAQKVGEKYRDRQEINKLNEEKKRASSQLGLNIYLAYKNNNNRVPQQTFNQKKIKSVLKELEELDKKILELSENDK